VGVGALSWITLQLEIRGWGRFHNRRQVASYTGLCPGIHNSKLCLSSSAKRGLRRMEGSVGF
jgi:transposase